MKKYIVTTTINKPSIATLKFISKQDWHIIIVGDTKTPHEEYELLEHQNSNVTYLSPKQQDEKYPELSAVIGWKTIERRNIGFVESYNSGADVIATVDDDNIPYDNWGKNLLVETSCDVDLYITEQSVFDPLSVTNYKHLWHRGFPIQLIENKNNVKYLGLSYQIKPLVQADLWDGDPDIDAFERIIWHPCVKFNPTGPYTGNKISPFNSQNTFLSRKCFPYYCVLPFVGRMDDIFGAYILQTKLPISVIYNDASVYQERNIQNLTTNLKAEYIGYEYCLELIERLSKNGGNIEDTGGIIPKESVEFYKIYQKSFNIL